MKGYYIHCVTCSDALRREIRELIPDMNVRRRMSRAVRMGVSAGLDSLCEFEPYGQVDAIVTATGLGCIADSEKFLANLIDDEERMLNPTPFIQSTFNTVGAQIALIRSLHGYNNTFSHRFTSFESALIDAMIRLDNGHSKAVLVGVFDEATETVRTIQDRLGLLKNKDLGEGAVFFVLTGEPLAASVARIDELSFAFDPMPEALSVAADNDTVWCGAPAMTLARAIDQKFSGYIVNDLGGKQNSRIKLTCLQPPSLS